MATWRKLTIGLLVSTALVMVAHALFIPTKAIFAQWLLLRAWQQTEADTGPRRPWPWADTYPVARLRLPRLGIDQVVLHGASGRVIAFGPGWVDSSSRPEARGNTVISGHRDTHFRWLADVRIADELILELPGRGRHYYRVTATAVHQASDTWLLSPELDERLRLLTCYPFEAVRPGAEQRFVVTAERWWPAGA